MQSARQETAEKLEETSKQSADQRTSCDKAKRKNNSSVRLSWTAWWKSGLRGFIFDFCVRLFGVCLRTELLLADSTLTLIQVIVFLNKL